jgi:hypothetical protein
MLQSELKTRVRHGEYVLNVDKVADAVLARVQRLLLPATPRGDSPQVSARRDDR